MFPHLPEDVRLRLNREFRIADQKIRESTDAFKKVYFLSAFYGEANRALNVAWDDELALLHMVLQAACAAANNRLQATTTGAERGMEFPVNYFEALTAAASDLASVVVNEAGDNELYRVLERFAELAYVTTGNGYYLYLKGAIKI